MNNKLDALLALLVYAGKRNLGWTNDWLIELLLQSSLSEKSIRVVTGATDDAIRKARMKLEASKGRKPSFWDKFKEH